MKLNTQLQKVKQKKAILTSSLESTGIPSIDVKLLQGASNSIVKLVQAKHFKDKVKHLEKFGKVKQKERSLSRASALCSLDPFIDIVRAY